MHANAARETLPDPPSAFMQRTLLLVPHEIAGLSVFGIGWVLMLILIAAGMRIYVAVKHRHKLADLLAGEGIMWAFVIVAIVFVVPMVELRNMDGEPVGMAIRGYGVMLISAVGAAVLVAAWRTKRRGIDPEAIFSLAPWVLVGGIAGARIFYLIQYREDYDWSTLGSSVGNLLSFTQGGLVVYGSFIGGVLASLIFIRRNKLPVLRLGDAIVPCMFLGVCIGRIGCLMNGCCYGGRCEEGWAALHFPAGSAVYTEQVLDGELLGLTISPTTQRITKVAADTPASKAAIKPGAKLNAIQFEEVSNRLAPKDIPKEDVLNNVVATVDGVPYRWSASELPTRALPVQAAQLISSGTGLLLFSVLGVLSYVLRRDGAIMFTGFAGYAILRFILEMVRVDEKGQFGTSLSISQWVSVIVFSISVVALVWVYRCHGDTANGLKEDSVAESG